MKHVDAWGSSSSSFVQSSGGTDGNNFNFGTVASLSLPEMKRAKADRSCGVHDRSALQNQTTRLSDFDSPSYRALFSISVTEKSDRPQMARSRWDHRRPLNIIGGTTEWNPRTRVRRASNDSSKSLNFFHRFSKRGTDDQLETWMSSAPGKRGISSPLLSTTAKGPS